MNLIPLAIHPILNNWNYSTFNRTAVIKYINTMCFLCRIKYDSEREWYL